MFGVTTREGRPGRHALGSALLVTGAIGALVGAGVATWQRRNRTVTVDPWVAATTGGAGLLAAADDEPNTPGDPRPEQL